jgi:hypothetical protein
MMQQTKGNIITINPPKNNICANSEKEHSKKEDKKHTKRIITYLNTKNVLCSRISIGISKICFSVGKYHIAVYENNVQLLKYTFRSKLIHSFFIAATNQKILCGYLYEDQGKHGRSRKAKLETKLKIRVNHLWHCIHTTIHSVS